MMDTFVGALRGLGYSVAPMIVSIVGVCGVRLLWIATVFQHIHTTDMLYISYPISWLATAIVHICVLLYVRKKSYREVAQRNESREPAEANS
jgi:Na+-driven multidrug efflux pump